MPGRSLLKRAGALVLASRFARALHTLGCITSDPSTLLPMRQITFWAAGHIFHAKLPLVYTGSGSGDKIFDWGVVFCLLVIAALASGIWSVLDRNRENYVTLNEWFQLFIRFALASQLAGASCF
jgi:hypothetical protein